MLTYVAVDQYGQTERLFSKSPRKELLEKLGTTKASKMYVDGKDGKNVLRRLCYTATLV